jgi:hypothetical protein
VFVDIAWAVSATGRATDEDEEDSGSERLDLDEVKPRNTLARAPERDVSGEDGSSPPWGRMCSDYAVDQIEDEDRYIHPTGGCYDAAGNR